MAFNIGVDLVLKLVLQAWKVRYLESVGLWFGDELDLEDVLVLLVGQARLVEPGEEEKVWQQEERHEDEVLHRIHAVVEHGHLADGLEDVAQARARAERADQLLRDRFDVTYDGRFTNGPRCLEDDRCEAGTGDAEVLRRVDNRAG